MLSASSGSLEIITHIGASLQHVLKKRVGGNYTGTYNKIMLFATTFKVDRAVNSTCFRVKKV